MYMSVYVCMCMCMCVWGRRPWEMINERKKKEKSRENKNLFIQINRQTYRQIDTNDSRIWDTILNNIVNQIQSHSIESNLIEWNQKE